MNVTSSVVLVSIPRLSYLWANDKKEDYYSLLNKSSDTFLAFHTPCCIGLACVSTEVIYFYSGIKYIAASLPLLLFSLRYYISAFDMILAKQVLLATGNEKILTKIYYIGGVYNVLIKIVLIFLGKLTSELCILVTATADILVIVLQLISIKKLGLQFKIFSKSILKYLITSLLFIPVVMIIKYFIHFDGINLILLRTLFSISTCALIYFFILFITKDPVVFGLIKHRKKDGDLVT
jgi:O-antigen/teichoic acid export membrane protein